MDIQRSLKGLEFHNYIVNYIYVYFGQPLFLDSNFSDRAAQLVIVNKLNVSIQYTI